MAADHHRKAAPTAVTTPGAGHDSLAAEGGLAAALAASLASCCPQSSGILSCSQVESDLAWLLASFCFSSLETDACLSSQAACKKLTLTPRGSGASHFFAWGR